jgi:hypothetical protein
VREKVGGIPETILVRSEENETCETENPREEEELDLFTQSVTQTRVSKGQVGEVSRTVGNHATNPFFLVYPFHTTTHEEHNNQSLVAIVLWESLEYEVCLETEEWSPICYFILLTNLEFERV